MTVSGSIVYEPTALEIINGAFSFLGIAQDGEALTPRMYADGLRALNGLIQTWSAQKHLWTEAEASLSLVSGQAAYNIVPRALRVLSCRYSLNGIDTPMTMLSRQEYYDSPNKNIATGVPVGFYFEPKIDNGSLYLWPSPSASVATQYTIRYTYVKFMDIVKETGETVPFPQQWIEPVMWNTAKRLMTQYPVNDPNLMRMVLSQAAEYEASLSQWDNEPTSLYMQPDYQCYGDYR